VLCALGPLAEELDRDSLVTARDVRSSWKNWASLS
jgi:hypothetical protein